MNFQPHSYQAYAIEYILQHPVAALFLDCGLEKTVIQDTRAWQFVPAFGNKRYYKTDYRVMLMSVCSGTSYARERNEKRLYRDFRI